jgi:LysR family transcriptional regulator, glycine cleavage system transcriptional activator
MRRLPPLTALEAFVQVARLGSVKAAAEALALSSPALSRRIQALERHVGHPLFERRHQAIRLNDAGERLLADIAPGLDLISEAMERATGSHALMRLKLGVLPLFASQRLMPRLGELRELHPDLHIDIDTGGHAIARLDDGLDVAITVTTEVEASLYARRIDSNRIVAIGARSLNLQQPGQLREATVLLHRDLPETFDVWRTAAGVPDLEPAAVDMFDSGQLILDAAAQGLGIAFMHESHFEAAHDDRLERLFGISAESPYSYWFACRKPALGKKPVRLFHDWLFNELAEKETA